MGKLTQRDIDVLSLLISEYVATASPVGSNAIAKRGGLGLSSATIRSVMAKMEEMGLLTHTHTSSGRIPTSEGLRYYVNTIINKREISEEEKEMIRRQFSGSGTSVEDVLKRTGRILSLVSNYTGLVVMPKPEHITFKHMEFLPLSTGKLLGIFVSREGMVHNRIIELDEEMTYPDIEKITNYCNNAYYGYSLEEALSKATKELEDTRAQYDRILSRALIWSKELMDEASESELVVHGEAKLLKEPEFSDVEKLKKVIEAIEEKKGLVHLLNRAAESEEVSVFIGNESPLSQVDSCSIVISSYKKDGRIAGTLGVIGPTRMNYSHVIPTIDFTAKIVNEMLSR